MMFTSAADKALENLEATSNTAWHRDDKAGAGPPSSQMALLREAAEYVVDWALNTPIAKFAQTLPQQRKA